MTRRLTSVIGVGYDNESVGCVNVAVLLSVEDQCSETADY